MPASREPVPDPVTYQQALLDLQSKLPIIPRRQTADTGKYTYSYADLAGIWVVVQPLLNEHRFTFNARIELMAEGGTALVLRGTLTHVPTGTSESSIFPLPEIKMAQQVGSWITFGRRYLLTALLNIVTEDEDDDAANAQQPPSRTAQRATPAQRRQAPPTGGTGRQQTAQRARPTSGPPLPSDGPDPSTPAQWQKMAIQFGEIGMADRGDRLAYCTAYAGRDLESAKGLTKREASNLIELLTAAGKLGDAERIPYLWEHLPGDRDTERPMDDMPDGLPEDGQP